MARPRKPWFRKSNKRWYVECNGKQVNLGPDRKEAFRLFHEMMAQPEPQPVRRTTSITLPELVDHFVEWVQRNRAPDTYEWYRYRLERLCRAHPRATAEGLKPFQVEEWVNGYELSVTSRRNYFRAVKRCFKWGKRQGYISSNPVADVEIPRAEHREVALTSSQFDELMSYVRNENLADLMRFTWQTGCRPQESVIIEAQHVDVSNQRCVLRTSESKGRKISRVVYMTDAAMKIVLRLMNRNPNGPLFRNTAGEPWTNDAINCAIDAIRFRMGKAEMKRQQITINDSEIASLVPKLSPTCNRGGQVVKKTPAELRCEAKRKLTAKTVKELVPRYSLYVLRHSFATNALRKGIDSLTVAVLLGHQDPSTLARVYQHLNQNPAHLLEEIRKTAG